MTRNRAGWGVTAAGATLAAGGVYAMWSGWDLILLERGWSLFIAGSVFLAGGVVTMALGRVVAHLARLGAGLPAAQSAQAIQTASPAPAFTPMVAPRQDAAPKTPEAAPAAWREPEPKAEQPFDRPDFAAMLGAELTPEQPTEVDRYTAGDATYVMMSDGSVEVRSPVGTQRYPSLAALRAEAESRQS
ncbi:hypothetical protein [Methylocystis parvus]|uniref:Uncharacterized protein n=1 Tax=Methylocystis parvus TaxID=134 RepID=A0A6B8MEA0_9HYPH|nr:hypothetical protein [Methylocystis parvus]QGM98950.1 hypothetical protein F7D14_16630 [Methylocystis parvus]WBK00693.1 hypothetical protein MMG94_02905 [Methylocystis parvus OBBP]